MGVGVLLKISFFLMAVTTKLSNAIARNCSNRNL